MIFVENDRCWLHRQIVISPAIRRWRSSGASCQCTKSGMSFCRSSERIRWSSWWVRQGLARQPRYGQPPGTAWFLVSYSGSNISSVLYTNRSVKPLTPKPIGFACLSDDTVFARGWLHRVWDGRLHPAAPRRSHECCQACQRGDGNRIGPGGTPCCPSLAVYHVKELIHLSLTFFCTGSNMYKK